MMQSGPFLRHALAYLRRDPKRPLDYYVSVLPLPWVVEQVYAVAQALIGRVIVNFVEEPETMMADLREIGPNFLLLAPRVWESIAADVRSRMMDSTWMKQQMFELGTNLGTSALARGRRSRLADVLLFRALRDRLGFTNLESAATGGAALGPETFRFFIAMGVPLRQLYGQTELAGAYTVHAPDDVNFDSVGTPFGTSDVRIDHPDENGVGEIVARTMGMFSGYYKNEEAIAAELRDGWLHTGDAGCFDKQNGHLMVIDRIKDIATTSGGARFSPMFIENKLKFSPYIAEAVILGHSCPWLAAIICIRFPIVAKWAEQRRITFTNYTNLAGRPEVYTLLREEVEKVNATLPEAHPGHRLVEQDAGQLDPFAQPVGQSARRCLADVRNFEEVADLLDLAAVGQLFLLRAAEPVERAGEEVVSQEAADHNVVQNRHVIERRQVLERPADAERRAGIRPQAGDVAPLEDDPSL